MPAKLLPQQLWDRAVWDGECFVYTGGSSTQGGHRSWGRHGYAHREAWRQQFGDVPEGMSVLHSCDNPPCLIHLFLGTQTDNINDAIRKGRHINNRGR